MMSRVPPVLLLASLAACSGDSAPLIASDVEVNKPRPGASMSAGYLTITNSTSDAVIITGVSSPQFAAVEMHETQIVDGVSRMRGLDSVTVPAGGSLAFSRGGKHLMLMRPTGEAGSVTLVFHAGDVPVLTVSASAAE